MYTKIDSHNVIFRRTDASDEAFKALVAKLDAYLTIRNGESDAFFSQFNIIEELKTVLVGYHNKTPICCGAIKVYDKTTMEIKRMFVLSSYRRNGLAKLTLKALEEWTKELGYTRCILETGTMLPEAIQLYQKERYKRIPNYDQYIGIETSRCFEKIV